MPIWALDDQGHVSGDEICRLVISVDSQFTQILTVVGADHYHHVIPHPGVSEGVKQPSQILVEIANAPVIAVNDSLNVRE